MDFLNGLTLVGIPVVVLMPLIIAWLKGLGLPASWTGVAAAIAGVLVAAAIQAIKSWPQLEPWVWVVVAGIVLGLAANGAYSQYKHITEVRAKDAGEGPETDLGAR